MTIIDAEHADKFRLWFKERSGVTRWTNLEIASGHPREVFTPGDVKTAPGWRYGNPQAVLPSDVQVNTPTILHTFRGRGKARYWGPDVSDATRTKADRLAALHGVGVSWRWEPLGDGLVQVEVVRDHLEVL